MNHSKIKTRNLLILFVAILVAVIVGSCNNPTETSESVHSRHSSEEPDVMSAEASPTTTHESPVVISARTSPAATHVASLLIENWLDRWLIHPPCSPPCWEGVTPGETPVEVAIEIFKSNPMFTKIEVDEATERVGYIILEWQIQAEDGRIWTKEAQLHYDPSEKDPVIWLIGYRVQPIRLADLIEVLGTPTHVKTSTVLSNFDQPISWGVDVIWASQGFAVNTGGASPILPLDEGLEFEWVTYFTPGIENFNEFSGPSLQENDFVSHWEGYADYEVYMKPTRTP
jgi:hypothetical protein